MLRHALALGLVLAALVAAPARAQQDTTGYSLSTEGFLSGTIVEVQQNDLCRLSTDGSCRDCDCCKGSNLCQGVHLTLKTGDRKVDVYVGPWWFVNQSEFTFPAGRLAVVLGSRVKLPMGTVLLAREITIGSDTYRLRDELGRPLWSPRFTN